MTRVTAFWDDSFLAHEPPAGEFEAAWTGRLAVEEPHPDRAARVENIRHILRYEFDDHVTWEPAPAATRAQLERVHDPSYVDSFEAFCRDGGGRLTAETGANEHSFEAARHAAGGAIAAVDCAIDTERAGIPYACVRPSGHHAQPAQADGFCFFNNVAVAAEHALVSSAVDSVAVVDWDVHHGNGTQECFYDRDDVLFVSLHNDHWSWDRDAHPQTGDLDESGIGDGDGYNLNVPLPPGTGDEGYTAAFDRVVAPVVGEFDPDLLLVSAGQDPGTVDPLGRNVVTKEGFRTLGDRARTLATAVDAPLALVQEGGYQVSHLPYATLGVLEGAVGVDTGIEDPFAWLDEDADSAHRRLDSVVEHASAWWDV
ncbi:acetoin utilization deacetylase AcuC-like enzyme [Halarchaeum solikamskense]|uniref:class II histone deacetylase n=1 Tax=Halarchaeum nitratireducens TaxID=489913 RepID=UPI001B3AD352|nr:acetoin utilization deacetylase AcuC-like enzyme [Halarchaeum solikamskense]